MNKYHSELLKQLQNIVDNGLVVNKDCYHKLCSILKRDKNKAHMVKGFEGLLIAIKSQYTTSRLDKYRRNK